MAHWPVHFTLSHNLKNLALSFIQMELPDINGVGLADRDEGFMLWNLAELQYSILVHRDPGVNLICLIDWAEYHPSFGEPVSDEPIDMVLRPFALLHQQVLLNPFITHSIGVNDFLIVLRRYSLAHSYAGDLLSESSLILILYLFEFLI